MKFVFVGNRKFVLDEMLKRKLSVADIFVVKDTHLERDLASSNFSHTLISSKQQLLERLNDIDFDVLISNGCPYIFPITKMKKKKYVNIHPSFLPDLKGVDPVIGAVLFNRDAGATCHVMDDTIDGGDIISQVKIPYSSDLDVSLLYQLSFLAEKEVFVKALERNFVSANKQRKNEDSIYYSRKPEDRVITFQESSEEMINKVKAFNNKSQGCLFKYKNETFKVYNIDVLHNEYLKEYASKFSDFEIILCYEDSIVFKKDGQLIRLYNVIGQLSRLKISSFINKG